MSCRPLALGSTDQLGPGSEARNATVLGLNDVDKQKLEEARQLAMSMTSHPVAFGTIEHTERAGELLAEMVKANEVLAREAHTWWTACRDATGEIERLREVAARMVAGIDHLDKLAREWEPDHSSGADRRGWLLAKDVRDDAARLLWPNAKLTGDQRP